MVGRHIRPKEIPFVNGGEIEQTAKSWNIRVRPFTINYPNGSMKAKNKSTIVDLAEYQVDVKGAYRWVSVYIDTETLDVGVFGDTQEFNKEHSQHTDMKKYRQFKNKNLIILSDIKFINGYSELHADNIDYGRRGSFMLSTSNYVSDGTDISDHIRAWNDGDVVMGYDGLLSGEENNNSDSRELKLRTTVSSFGSDTIVFTRDPKWITGLEFSVIGAQTESNNGYYIVSSVNNGVYTVTRRVLNPPSVSISVDANPGGIATLAKVKNMNTEYINLFDNDYILLNPLEYSGNKIDVNRCSETISTMAYVANDNNRNLIISNPGETKPMRCKTSDTPECLVPDTTGGEWSSIVLGQDCDGFCEHLCQASCEELCQASCETECECGREASIESICQSVDYSGVFPHSLNHKCDATVEISNEIGSTCFSCDASCDVGIGGCHTPPPSCGDCDSCDAAVENACLSCDKTCEDHTRCYQFGGGGGNGEVGCVSSLNSLITFNGGSDMGAKDSVSKDSVFQINKSGGFSLVEVASQIALNGSFSAKKNFFSLVDVSVAIKPNLVPSETISFVTISAERTYRKDSDGRTEVFFVHYQYFVELGSQGSLKRVASSFQDENSLIVVFSNGVGGSRSEWETPSGGDPVGSKTRKQWVTIKEPSGGINGWTGEGNWAWDIVFQQGLAIPAFLDSGTIDKESFKFETAIWVDGRPISESSLPIRVKVVMDKGSLVVENSISGPGNVVDPTSTNEGIRMFYYEFNNDNFWNSKINRIFAFKCKVLVTAEFNSAASYRMFNYSNIISINVSGDDDCDAYVLSRDFGVFSIEGKLTGNACNVYDTPCHNEELCSLKEMQIINCVNCENLDSKFGFGE